MIKTEIVHNFTEMSNKNINYIKINCFAHFMINITENLFKNDIKADGFNYKIETGLQNYDKFNSLGNQISYNNKNIVFETTYTDLKDYFINSLKDYSEDKPNNSDEPECKYSIINQLKAQCKENNKESSVAESLFGLGEFPFMIITVTRIGNKEYYFYKITR